MLSAISTAGNNIKKFFEPVLSDVQRNQLTSNGELAILSSAEKTLDEKKEKDKASWLINYLRTIRNIKGHITFSLLLLNKLEETGKKEVINNLKSLYGHYLKASLLLLFPENSPPQNTNIAQQKYTPLDLLRDFSPDDDRECAKFNDFLETKYYLARLTTAKSTEKDDLQKKFSDTIHSFVSLIYSREPELPSIVKRECLIFFEIIRNDQALKALKACNSNLFNIFVETMYSLQEQLAKDKTEEMLKEIIKRLDPQDNPPLKSNDPEIQGLCLDILTTLATFLSRNLTTLSSKDKSILQDTEKKYIKILASILLYSPPNENLYQKLSKLNPRLGYLEQAFKQVEQNLKFESKLIVLRIYLDKYKNNKILINAPTHLDKALTYYLKLQSENATKTQEYFTELLQLIAGLCKAPQKQADPSKLKTLLENAVRVLEEKNKQEDRQTASSSQLGDVQGTGIPQSDYPELHLNIQNDKQTVSSLQPGGAQGTGKSQSDYLELLYLEQPSLDTPKGKQTASSSPLGDAQDTGMPKPNYLEHLYPKSEDHLTHLPKLQFHNQQIREYYLDIQAALAELLLSEAQVKRQNISDTCDPKALEAISRIIQYSSNELPQRLKKLDPPLSYLEQAAKVVGKSSNFRPKLIFLYIQLDKHEKLTDSEEKTGHLAHILNHFLSHHDKIHEELYSKLPKTFIDFIILFRPILDLCRKLPSVSNSKELERLQEKFQELTKSDYSQLDLEPIKHALTLPEELLIAIPFPTETIKKLTNEEIKEGCKLLKDGCAYPLTNKLAVYANTMRMIYNSVILVQKKQSVDDEICSTLEKALEETLQTNRIMNQSWENEAKYHLRILKLSNSYDSLRKNERFKKQINGKCSNKTLTELINSQDWETTIETFNVPSFKNLASCTALVFAHKTILNSCSKEEKVINETTEEALAFLEKFPDDLVAKLSKAMILMEHENYLLGIHKALDTKNKVFEAKAADLLLSLAFQDKAGPFISKALHLLNALQKNVYIPYVEVAIKLIENNPLNPHLRLIGERRESLEKFAPEEKDLRLIISYLHNLFQAVTQGFNSNDILLTLEQKHFLIDLAIKNFQELNSLLLGKNNSWRFQDSSLYTNNTINLETDYSELQNTLEKLNAQIEKSLIDSAERPSNASAPPIEKAPPETPMTPPTEEYPNVPGKNPTSQPSVTPGVLQNASPPSASASSPKEEEEEEREENSNAQLAAKKTEFFPSAPPIEKTLATPMIPPTEEHPNVSNNTMDEILKILRQMNANFEDFCKTTNNRLDNLEKNLEKLTQHKSTIPEKQTTKQKAPGSVTTLFGHSKTKQNPTHMTPRRKKLENNWQQAKKIIFHH